MIRITLDSNIYISAFFFRGQAFAHPGNGPRWPGGHRHIRRILQETLGIMRHKFKLPEERVAQARQRVSPSESVNVVSDPPDNRILECAQTAGSEFIITGDQHLLRLGKFGGVWIVRHRSIFSMVRKSRTFRDERAQNFTIATTNRALHLRLGDRSGPSLRTTLTQWWLFRPVPSMLFVLLFVHSQFRVRPGTDRRFKSP